MKSHPPSTAHRRSPSRVRSGPRPAPVRPGVPFPAFIAYADLPAARRAMAVINDVLGAVPGRFAFKPMLWRFDQLASAKWCDYALTDAADATVVVLASSTAGAVPPAIEHWIALLLNRKRGGQMTIVSLQGDEEAWTITIEAPASPAAVQALPAAMTERAA